MRSSLLTGAATMAATLATLAATLSSGGMAYAQARRATAPATTGGTAEYWMSAETTSGLAAQTGMSAQGGRPNMLSALAGGGALRNGPGYLHNLHLELGSPRRAAGTPQADHFIPAGLNAGPSLPLVSPEPNQAITRPYQGPGGGDGGANARIIIYFGCGEHVRPGQPVEIDLSRMGRGQVPPAMAQLALQAANGPSQGNSATFGEWPNQRSRTTIPASGSLIGAHRIVGNYSPEIDFTLGQGQDFLAPIRITQNARGPSGAVPVAWQAVPNATGYFLMAVGSRDANTIVMWSSSETQVQQGAFDYLSPTEVARLIAQRVVLTPATTQCTVPAEFSQGLQGASLMMTAFGPEANFATPRPASAPRTWRPDWTVKFRTRSTYAGLLGQDLEAMMRGDRSTARDSTQGQQQPERRRRRGLGGLIGGIVGQ